MPTLFLNKVAGRDGHVKHLPVQLASLSNLRLQVLELDGRDEDADAIGVTCSIALSTRLVETVDVHHLERGDQGELINADGVDLIAVEDSGQRLQVLVQGVKHEEGLCRLQRAQVPQECLHLCHEQIAELLFVLKVGLSGQHLRTRHEQLHLLDQVRDRLYEAIIVGLSH